MGDVFLKWLEIIINIYYQIFMQFSTCFVLVNLVVFESSDPECAGYPWFRFYAHVPTCGPLMRDTRKATSPMIEIAAN